MSTIRYMVSIISVAVLVLTAGLARSENFPNKPIRILATEPGGGGDFISRIIAQEISGPLGQPVIVENRPGAIAGSVAVKATPDGYTLLVQGNSFWFEPLLRLTPYDPIKDFSPITLSTRQPHVLVVHPSVPARSVTELIALAKAQPGVINYATTVVGGAIHLSAALFKSMAGINITNIPYKGSAVATNAVLSGEVQMMFPSASNVTPFIKSGRLRALAVTTAQPSVLFPGLPTVASSGLPGYEFSLTSGVFAPANTPKPIINYLNREIVRALTSVRVKEKILDTALEVVASSPEQFAATLKDDRTKWSKVIKEAGIKAE